MMLALEVSSDASCRTLLVHLVWRNSSVLSQVPTPYTLHPTPYTPQPALYTLHPTPFTLHPTPFTLHLTLRPPWGVRECENESERARGPLSGVPRTPTVDQPLALSAMWRYRVGVWERERER